MLLSWCGLTGSHQSTCGTRHTHTHFPYISSHFGDVIAFKTHNMSLAGM